MTSPSAEHDGDGFMYASGIRLTGTFDEGGPAGEVRIVRISHAEREIVVCVSQRLFGLDWYEERTRFRARLVGPDDEGSVSVEPTSSATIERAEWWRRWGYYLVARPFARGLWHGWQRWRVTKDDENS